MIPCCKHSWWLCWICHIPMSLLCTKQYSQKGSVLYVTTHLSIHWGTKNVVWIIVKFRLWFVNRYNGLKASIVHIQAICCCIVDLDEHNFPRKPSYTKLSTTKSILVQWTTDQMSTKSGYKHYLDNHSMFSYIFGASYMWNFTVATMSMLCPNKYSQEFSLVCNYLFLTPLGSKEWY